MGRHVLGLEQEGLALTVEIGADDGESSKRDAREVVGHEIQELGIGAGNARMHARLGLHACPECGRSAFELLVSDEALDENLAERVAVERCEFVVDIVFVGGCGGIRRNERRGLDVEERGRHQQKIARDIEIKRLDALDLGEILLRDFRDRDRADIDFLLGDKL